MYILNRRVYTTIKGRSNWNQMEETKYKQRRWQYTREREETERRERRGEQKKSREEEGTHSKGKGSELEGLVYVDRNSEREKDE